MRLRLRAPDRARSALLASAVVAIVLGILSMHGVDAHGVTTHGAMAHADAGVASASVRPFHDPVGAGRHDPHVAAHSGTTAAEHTVHDVSDVDGMGGMVMLCVAILVGAAAVLGLLVHRRRPTKVWAVLQPAGRWLRTAPHVLRVGTGPPSVWRFSVIRC